MSNLLQLFARAKRYASLDNGQTREALCLATVTAQDCETFADRLQNPDAQRTARTAYLLPNRARLPALADALRTEAANAVSEKPIVRKPAPRAVLDKHATREALKHAARAFPKTRQTRIAYLAIVNLALAHNLAMPKPRKRKSDICPFVVHDEVLELAYAPTQENLANAVSALYQHDAMILRQHDALPVRLLNPNVKAPEPNAPIVHRIPTGALDWATQPIIGMDPAQFHEEAEHIGRKAAMERRIEKRASRIKGAPQPKKRAKRAAKVQEVIWKARMGREVLTLKK